jgi:hypothetical protein
MQSNSLRFIFVVDLDRTSPFLILLKSLSVLQAFVTLVNSKTMQYLERNKTIIEITNIKMGLNYRSAFTGV